MGRKVKLTSDPALAKPHAAGAKMALVQPSIHGVFGPLFVKQVSHIKVHFNWAAQRRQQLKTLDDRIQVLEVGTGGGRHVDEPLVTELYMAGVDMAIQTVLIVQHLVLYLERLSPGNVAGQDLTARLGAVLKRLGYRTDLATDVRYIRLCEIENMRHAIEHPTSDNIYTADTNGWDRVPLTWIATGRAAAAFDLAAGFLKEVGVFAAGVEARRKGTQTVQVQRGVKATNPARKPRTLGAG